MDEGPGSLWLLSDSLAVFNACVPALYAPVHEARSHVSTRSAEGPRAGSPARKALASLHVAPFPFAHARARMRGEKGKNAIPNAVWRLGFEMYIPILGTRYTLL